VFLQFIKCSDEAKEKEAETKQEVKVATEVTNSAKVETTEKESDGEQVATKEGVECRFDVEVEEEQELLHQGGHHGLGVEALEVGVGLAGAHEHDGLARDVGHRDGGAHLVIYGVELGEDNPVYGVRVLL